MGELISVLLILAAFLPVTLLIHALLSRLGRRESEQPAQGAALRAVGLTILSSLALGGVTHWGSPTFVPTVMYIGLSVTLLGSGYFVMFCNTESGRRYHIVRLLGQRGGIEEQELRDLYSPKYMIEIRLDRLLRWKAIEMREGRLCIRTSRPVRVCQFFYLWSRLLGFSWGPRQRSVTTPDATAGPGISK